MIRYIKYVVLCCFLVILSAQLSAGSKPKVVFIHGMFFSKDCWNEWDAYFTAKGFECMNIAWPEKNEIGMANRITTEHENIANLTLTKIVNYYDSIITTMPDTPYLVGHSMGGLVVQLLLQRGKGKAGVAIHSAPAKGIKSNKWSYIKSNWPAVSPSIPKDKAYLMPFKRYKYSMANMLSKIDQQTTWRKWIMYESIKVWKAPTTNEAKIDYKKSTKPLLFIAGTKDRIIPYKIVKKNAKKYASYNANVTYKCYKNRGHMVVYEQGWKEIADDVILWLNAH
ncbi:MAG: alpha/beta hydrolase [Bacteroidetes bacterium]|nr:alpha/beta hydrolase [Bacteroidota bacterium]